MAGVKGRSGGARKGTGGARPGAGRKKKAPATESSKAPVQIDDCDMLKLLQDVALGRVQASTIQVRAAIAAVQYTHTKRGDGGKKEEVAGKAKTAGQGKFKPSPTPLKLVGAK